MACSFARVVAAFVGVLLGAVHVPSACTGLEGTISLPHAVIESAVVRLASLARVHGVEPILEVNFDQGRFFHATRRHARCRIGVSFRILPRFAGFLEVTRDPDVLSTMMIAHEIAHCVDTAVGVPALHRELAADAAAVLAARCFHPEQAHGVAVRWFELRRRSAREDPDHDTSAWGTSIVAVRADCTALFRQATTLRDRLVGGALVTDKTSSREAAESLAR
jgi:hypothetical protein